MLDFYAFHLFVLKECGNHLFKLFGDIKKKLEFYVV